MKVIDLLNKIANGEEVPKKIHFKYSTYQFDKIDKVYRNINGNQHLEQDYMISNKLNDEVEILEESKGIPEKIKLTNGGLTLHDNNNDYTLSVIHKCLINKINEILDYLESKGDEV